MPGITNKERLKRSLRSVLFSVVKQYECGEIDFNRAKARSKCILRSIEKADAREYPLKGSIEE